MALTPCESSLSIATAMLSPSSFRTRRSDSVAALSMGTSVRAWPGPRCGRRDRTRCMALDRDVAVRRWSEALARVEVLEPWLTESHWDEHYWDDVATRVVELLGADRDRSHARDAVEA